MIIAAEADRGAIESRASLLVGGGALIIAFSSILVSLSGSSPATAAIFRCVYALPILLCLRSGTIPVTVGAPGR